MSTPQPTDPLEELNSFIEANAVQLIIQLRESQRGEPAGAAFRQLIEMAEAITRTGARRLAELELSNFALREVTRLNALVGPSGKSVEDLEKINDELLEDLAVAREKARRFDAFIQEAAERVYFPMEPISPGVMEILKEIAAKQSQGDNAADLPHEGRVQAATVHHWVNKTVWLLEWHDPTDKASGVFYTGFTDLMKEARTTYDPWKALHYDDQERAIRAARELKVRLGYWKPTLHRFE